MPQNHGDSGGDARLHKPSTEVGFDVQILVTQSSEVNESVEPDVSQKQVRTRQTAGDLEENDVKVLHGSLAYEADRDGRENRG